MAVFPWLFVHPFCHIPVRGSPGCFRGFRGSPGSPKDQNLGTAGSPGESFHQRDPEDGPSGTRGAIPGGSWAFGDCMVIIYDYLTLTIY